MSDKAVVYSRVSTTDQDAGNQYLAIRTWAKARLIEIIDHYSEQETAWRAGHQKELARLVKDAQQGKFSYVLVWSLDRLSRQGSLAILELINRLSHYKVKVISYQEPWTEAPGELSELLFSLAGWVARMESQRRSERTKAGLARLIAQGKKLGRPKGSKNKRRIAVK